MRPHMKEHKWHDFICILSAIGKMNLCSFCGQNQVSGCMEGVGCSRGTDWKREQGNLLV